MEDDKKPAMDFKTRIRVFEEGLGVIRVDAPPHSFRMRVLEEVTEEGMCDLIGVAVSEMLKKALSVASKGEMFRSELDENPGFAYLMSISNGGKGGFI